MITYNNDAGALMIELAHECANVRIAPADDAGFDMTPIEDRVCELVTDAQLDLWADERGIERHKAQDDLVNAVIEEMAHMESPP